MTQVTPTQHPHKEIRLNLDPRTTSTYVGILSLKSPSSKKLFGLGLDPSYHPRTGDLRHGGTQTGKGPGLKSLITFKAQLTACWQKSSSWWHSSLGLIAGLWSQTFPYHTRLLQKQWKMPSRYTAESGGRFICGYSKIGKIGAKRKLSRTVL